MDEVRSFAARWHCDHGMRLVRPDIAEFTPRARGWREPDGLTRATWCANRIQVISFPALVDIPRDIRKMYPSAKSLEGAMEVRRILPFAVASLMATTVNGIAQEVGRVAGPEDAARPKLECRTAVETSPIQRSPQATATIPPEAGPGWVVTGGGCQTFFNGHWPPVSQSMPSGNGWRCQGNDPPNIPLNFSISAYAVYCRVK